MSRYRVKFTSTFPGTVLLPGDYLGTCVPGSVTRSPSEQPHQRSFSRARLHGRCRSHPLRQPECSGNSISPYPPTPPSLLAAMLRSIPGWRALHPGRHPICPPHFPAQEGRQRGEKGRRNHPSRTCNRVAATASCRRHGTRKNWGHAESAASTSPCPRSVTPRRRPHGELAPQAGQDGKKRAQRRRRRRFREGASDTTPAHFPHPLPHRTCALPLCRGGMR